jgi:hypothetical protein
MYISHEAPEQTDKRLKEVIKQSELKIYDGFYSFEESPLNEHKFNPSALVIVKDEEVWSQLVATSSINPDKELFKVFRFQFKAGLDNSGFVGWLATRIKREVGTGVFVVCGNNNKRGGIFDYWGCPVSVGDKVIKLIHAIRKQEEVPVG